MNKPEKNDQKSDKQRQSSKKLQLILLSSMIVYCIILLVVSSGHFTPTQVWFVVQLLNTLGFFLGLIAFIKSYQRE
jgi:uncharacterized membrane protein